MTGINLEKLNKNSKEYSLLHRVPSGCAVFGIINESGKNFSGRKVIDGITLMHERSNGLGGGFAAYGIYPEFGSDWAFHIFYDDMDAKKNTEKELENNFDILLSEEIPTRKTGRIENPPIIYRYFLKTNDSLRESGGEEDFIVGLVMRINTLIRGAYIISSGKNMGIFKGVGYPEDIGEFYRLDEYKGYLWTSHGRFPTNSVGWWGGAHPFGLLDWSVVHNGEISSYGTNKRFVSGFGYECTLSTDTEVITYLFDLLVRKQKINMELVHLVLASPLWEEIERMQPDASELAGALRMLYGSALLNGPFNIIVGSSSSMYALNDRIKLRPMVAARQGDYLIVSSEEAPIRKVFTSADRIWHPNGGEPVIGILKKDLQGEINNNDKLKSAGAVLSGPGSGK